MTAALQHTTRELSTTETAKEIRTFLKGEYPGVKFSVRSSNYAGGSSIDVTWTDGPRASAVSANLERFEGATFDGMSDMKEYKDPTLLANPDGSLETIRYGVDFVLTHRDISQGWREEIAALMSDIAGEPVDLTSCNDVGPDGQPSGRNGDGWNTRYDLTVIDGQIVPCAGLADSDRYGSRIFTAYAAANDR